MRFKIYFFLFLVILFYSSCSEPEIPKYKNAKISTEERVNDLIPRMTLEEKVAQLLCTTDKNKIWDSTFKFSENKASAFMHKGWGQIGFGAGDPLFNQRISCFYQSNFRST